MIHVTKDTVLLQWILFQYFIDHIVYYHCQES